MIEYKLVAHLTKWLKNLSLQSQLDTAARVCMQCFDYVSVVLWNMFRNDGL